MCIGSLYHGLDLDGGLLKLLLFLPMSGQVLLGGLLLFACEIGHGGLAAWFDACSGTGGNNDLGSESVSVVVGSVMASSVTYCSRHGT